MKKNTNTVDNYYIAIENVEMEDDQVQAITRNLKGHFSLSTPMTRKKDRKRRVIGLGDFDKRAIRGQIVT